ncbi:MAG: FecR domain-containing protein [Bdellovibrionales bacterium]
MSYLFLLILSASQAWSGEWKILAVQGEVWRERQNEKIAISQNVDLQDGDLVSTGPGARLQLITNGSVLSLGGKTKLRLVTQTPTSDRPLNLWYGKLRALVQPEPNRKFEIETPAAVSGVRGTEYYLSVDHHGEFVCTLHGLVQVQAKKDGQTLEVPARAGVHLHGFEPMHLEPTPEEDVQSWVGETSVESLPVVQKAYGMSWTRWKELSHGLFVSRFAQVNLFHTENAAYTSNASSSSQNAAQVRLSPGLRWGRKNALVFRPRVILHNSKDLVHLEDRSVLNERNTALFRMGELYADGSIGGARLRAGAFEVDWDDGTLYSTAHLSLQPQTFSGGWVNGRLGDYYWDALATVRGAAPADAQALRLRYRNLFSVVGSHRDYETSYSGKRVHDLGLFSDSRAGRWEWQAHFIRQWTDRSATSLRAEVGWYPWRSKNFVLGGGYREASRDFVPGFEPKYALGYSQVFVRSNLRQYVAQLGWDNPDHRWRARLNYLASESLGIGRETLWSGVNSKLMGEWDLGLERDWAHSHSVAWHFFYLEPTNHLKNSSPTWPKKNGWGTAAYVRFNF